MRRVRDGCFRLADSKRLVVVDLGTGLQEALDTDTWQSVAMYEPTTPGTGEDRIGLVGLTDDGSSIIGVGGYLGNAGGSLHWLDAETLGPSRPPVRDVHEGSPKSAALSPDSSRLATGASDGIVRIWDATSGSLIHEIPFTGTQIQGVDFIDGDRLAVVGQTGTVRIVTTDADELLAVTRASLTRTLTAAECERFAVKPCPSLAELSEATRSVR
jgi:WD40 repeat protein